MFKKSGSKVRWSIAIAAMLGISGCRTAESYIGKGNTLFKDGKFAEAELNYRKALQKDPNSGEAYYRVALADLRLNKPMEAFRALTQAVRLAPANEAARVELTNLALPSYIEDPQHPKALYDQLIQLSRQFLAKDPNSFEGLRINAYLAMEERRPEEAAELFRRALRSNPTQEKAVLGLMDSLYRSKAIAEAEKTGLDYLQTTPSAADVYDALYRLYIATGRIPDGESILIRKAKNNPGQAEFSLQLAAHYARVHKTGEMAAAMQNFLKNPGAGAGAHLEAGDFYMALADWTKAIEQYNAGAAGNPQQAQQYQDRIARALLSQNKLEEGLKNLDATLARNPEDQEAHALRAAALIATGKSQKSGEAIREVDALVEKSPDDLFLKFMSAKAHQESGDLAGARTRLLEVVKQRPSFVDAQVMLADIAFNQGNMQQTAEHAKAALDLNPNLLRAQMLYGSALLRQGNLNEAGIVLGRLAREVPKSPDVQLELAFLDLDKHDYPKAEAAFKKLLSANPNEWRAIEGLADVSLSQKRYEKAMAYLEGELKRTHGAPQIQSLLASTALKNKNYTDAVHYLSALIESTPNAISARLELANVFRIKGDTRNAIATLEKAAAAAPNDTRPPELLAFLLQSDNRKQEAKAQARKAYSMRPDDPASMNNLAFLLAETGDNLDEALKLARDSLAKAPAEASFSDTLGYVYLKRDQKDNALEIFNGLVRKYPGDPTFAYHLGLALFEKGDKTRAKAEFARAMGQRPTPEIETSIQDLLLRMQ